MEEHRSLSCVIIGEGTLPIRCAEILLQRGHVIRGVVSPDGSVGRWAEENGIPAIGSWDALEFFLSQHPFDYLFSIVNSLVLSRSVLALPQQCVINYHDGPLPCYAGSHATSWALMNREERHGVSWHVASEQVDAGDVLKQRAFEIAAGETALSLNARCYDAALASF